MSMASLLQQLCRFPTAVGGAVACRYLSTSRATSAGKIYEFRAYAIQPSKTRESVGVMEDLVAVRTRHSRMIGCWFTELGGLNEANFIWEYDNFSHRTAVRKALAESEEWQDRCLPNLLPLLVSQTNMLWKPFPWYEPSLEPVTGYGVYELTRHDVKPGLLSQYMHVIREGVTARLHYPDYPKPMGIWYTEFGPYHSVFCLQPHVNFEAREKFEAERSKNLVELELAMTEAMKLTDSASAKAMVPAKFSPLQ